MSAEKEYAKKQLLALADEVHDILDRPHDYPDDAFYNLASRVKEYFRDG